MNKKVSLGTAVTLMAIAAALAVAITMVYSIRTFNDKLYNIKEREATYEKLSQIDKIVRSEYYGNIDEKYLMMNAEDYNCMAVVSSHTYNSDGVMFEYTQSRHRPDYFRFYDNAVRKPI